MPGAISNSRGFTLIELMVVIAIIGLISSIVLASLGGAKTKSTNARIISDIHQYQNALELYYTTNGSYPVPSTGIGNQNNKFVCLGNYGGAGSLCWNNGYTEDSTFDALVKQYFPGYPGGPTVVGAQTITGYIYRCTAGTAPACATYQIYYVLNGNGQTCPALNGVVVQVNGFQTSLTECQLTVSS